MSSGAERSNRKKKIALKNGDSRPAGTHGLIHVMNPDCQGPSLDAGLVGKKYDGDLLVVHMEHQAAKQPGKE